MNALLRSLPVLVFIGCLLPGCGDRQSSDDHLNNGKNFIKEGKFPEAIIELKNALKQDDTNAQARTTLGTLYFDRAYYADSDKELSKALAAGTDPTAIVPVLSQVLLGLGEYDRLNALPLDGLDAESRSTLLAAQGLAKLYSDDVDGASELIETATQSESSSSFAEVAAARLAMVKGDSGTARTRLAAVIAATPKFAPAWSLLGDIEQHEKHFEAAEKAYTKAMTLTKNSFEAQLNRAMLRINIEDYEGADKDLTRLETNYGEAKEHPGVTFARGLIYLHTEKIDDAIEALQYVSNFSNAYPESLYYLAVIYARKGQVEQALDNLNQYLILKPENAQGSKLAANLEMQKKNFRAAERLLLPVLAEDKNDLDAMDLLATARLGQGNHDSGIELLARVAKKRPKSQEAKARLAVAYLDGGREKLGIETLNGMLAEDPGYDNADIIIVKYYLREKQPAKAVEAALEYVHHNPSVKSYVLLAQTYLMNSESEQARGAFNKALELKPGDPEAGISLAGYALVDKDYDAARQYYQQILDHNPDHMETRMKFAATFVMEGKEQEMLKYLDATLAEYPRAMEPRLVKARYYIAKNQLEMAIPLLEALSDKQKATPDALETEATLELATNRFNQAVATVGRLIDTNPNIAEYHYMKSQAYAGLGDNEKLSDELDRTLELDPKHFGAEVALARLALLSDNTLVFEDKLVELKKVAPDNPSVVQLEVAYAFKQGDNKRAEQLLEGLFKREPTTSNAIALATLRQSAGDVNGAITRLQHWLETNAGDVEVRGKLAELYGSTNQAKEVMFQCQEILKLEPNNLVALNNLAWYLLNDDPKQALTYAERAVALSPESSPILDTLAIAQLKTNDIKAARQSIDRALATDPKSPLIRFHEARIRAAEGDKDGAVVALSALLNREEEFSERQEAEAFLKALKSREG